MIISEEIEQTISAPKSERPIRRGERGAANAKEEQKKNSKKDEKGKGGKTNESEVP